MLYVIVEGFQLVFVLYSHIILPVVVFAPCLIRSCAEVRVTPAGMAGRLLILRYARFSLPF